MKVTNTQAGPRGVNTVKGPVLVEPGETADVEIFEREKEHLEAAGWFTVEGEYTPDRKTEKSADLGSTNVNAEVADLKRQLAEKDLEIAKLKGESGGHDRDALKKQATELGVSYAHNVTDAKLKELIDAKLASNAGSAS